MVSLASEFLVAAARVILIWRAWRLRATLAGGIHPGPIIRGYKVRL